MKRQRTIPLARSQSLVKRRQAPFRIPRGVGLTGTGFPKQLRTKLRYVESGSITTAAGFPGTHQWTCNGLFDPNITGTGHQPMYFDQLAAIYNHYTVLKSKITVYMINTASTNAFGGLYIEDDTTITPTRSDSMCEQNSSAFRMISSVGQATNPVVFTKSWDAVQAFGPNPLANDNLQGSSAANPTEQQYYTVFTGDIAASAVTSVNLLVVIEYETVWDELKNIVGS